MTASKSSRARAQRAQANAARNGGAAGPASGNGTAVKAGAPVKASAPVKAGSTPRTVAARGGAPERRGPRGPAVEREVAAEARATGTVPLWMQLATFALALAGLGVSIYLTIAHFTESALLGCSESGLVNCTRVTTSPLSEHPSSADWVKCAMVR